jgi:hypothetical protein
MKKSKDELARFFGTYNPFKPLKRPHTRAKKISLRNHFAIPDLLIQVITCGIDSSEFLELIPVIPPSKVTGA